MRKCPNCAGENIYENLFCKHCGYCLLPPEPEKVHWSITTHTEHHKPHEGVNIDVRQIVENSRAANLKRRRRAVPSGVGVGIILLNVLVIILISQLLINLILK